MTITFWFALLFAVIGWSLFLIEAQFHRETKLRLEQSWEREEEYRRREAAHLAFFMPTAPWSANAIAARKASGLPMLMLAFLLLTPLAASAQSLRMSVGAILIGNGLDAASTEIALQRPGTREANPIGATPTTRLVMKSAGTAAQVWLVTKIAKKGHPKLAAGLGYALGGMYGAIAVRNWSVSR